MSSEAENMNEMGQILGTLNVFDKLFEVIVKLSQIGLLTTPEDAVLANIVGDLQDLQKTVGSRIVLEVVASLTELELSRGQEAQEELRDLVLSSDGDDVNFQLLVLKLLNPMKEEVLAN